MTNLTRRAWLEGASILAATSGAAHGASPAHMARLSLNENPFGPSPLALAAIRAELSSLPRYTADRGDALQAQVAALEGVSPDQIILGEILDVLGLHLALTGPRGGEFLYCEPGYTALVDAVAPGGGMTVAVPLTEKQENDLPAIAARITGKTRAVYIVNPHNPSGTVSEATAFLTFVRRIARQTLVIVDEAYLEYLPDFATRTTAALVREGANVIVFRTFGKIYGLAGLAIGYAIAPKSVAASLRKVGLGATLELNRLSVAAASASLQDRDYVSRMRRLVATERDKWNALFTRLKLRHADARANFVFFETDQPHATFAATLRAGGVEIGRAFPSRDRWARISIGLPEENALARALTQKALAPQ